MVITFYNMNRDTTELWLMMKSEFAFPVHKTPSMLRVIMETYHQPGALSTRPGESVIRVRSSSDLKHSTSSTELTKVIQHLHLQQLLIGTHTTLLASRSASSYPKIAPITTNQVPVTRSKRKPANDIENTVNSVIPCHTTGLATQQIFVDRSLNVLFQYEY